MAGRGGAPRSTQNSEKEAWRSPTCATYSARNASHPVRSSSGEAGERRREGESAISSGLQDMIRTHGRPAGRDGGKGADVVLTITSGCQLLEDVDERARRRSGRRRPAPARSAAMKLASWSSVPVRNTGAVSRMKSFQNWPGASGSPGAAESRISRSSKPLASRLPAKDSSATKTTRWPRRRSTSPMPTQLFVGPNAPSGKKTIVRRSGWLMTRQPNDAAAADGPARALLQLRA